MAERRGRVTWFDERLGESPSWSQYMKNTFIDFEQEERERAFALRRERSAPACAILPRGAPLPIGVSFGDTWGHSSDSNGGEPDPEQDAPMLDLEEAELQVAVAVKMTTRGTQTRSTSRGTQTRRAVRSRGRSALRNAVRSRARAGLRRSRGQSSGVSSGRSSGYTSGRSSGRRSIRRNSGRDSRRGSTCDSRRGSSLSCDSRRRFGSGSRFGSRCDSRRGSFSDRGSNRGSRRGSKEKARSVGRCTRQAANADVNVEVKQESETDADQILIGHSQTLCCRAEVSVIEAFSTDVQEKKPERKSLSREREPALEFSEVSEKKFQKRNSREENSEQKSDTENHLPPKVGQMQKAGTPQRSILLSNRFQMLESEVFENLRASACEALEDPSESKVDEAEVEAEAEVEVETTNEASDVEGKAQGKSKVMKSSRRKRIARAANASTSQSKLTGRVTVGKANDEKVKEQDVDQIDTVAERQPESLQEDQNCQPEQSALVKESDVEKEKTENGTEVAVNQERQLPSSKKRGSRNRKKGAPEATVDKENTSNKDYGMETDLKVEPSCPDDKVEDPSASSSCGVSGAESSRQLNDHQAYVIALMASRGNEQLIARYLRAASCRTSVVVCPVDPSDRVGADMIEVEPGDVVHCEAIDGSGWGFGTVIAPVRLAGQRG
eukprot:gnl/MRDRNA2_/MRDRNA2_32930_c0_seq1.p1 gnl/MRDRNA2_/MRDRNA2_32930_c0~~gnl/MRDRNA2_/MRDRNA2_32930_c0_seq1.p1  ORF type:complete len:667 (+),score=130.05 gnl/MRDRNA2_/MRDRNA2_32930_c0_seq1:101-2101(+)